MDINIQIFQNRDLAETLPYVIILIDAMGSSPVFVSMKDKTIALQRPIMRHIKDPTTYQVFPAEM